MDSFMFRSDVRRAVVEAIAGLPAGTVGIGADCLWQLTATHIHSEHGPRGTNAAYYAREMFNEVIRGRPFSRFIIDNPDCV